MGQRDISYPEIAEVFGRALGKPDLKYIQISEDNFLSAMTEIGVSSSASRKFHEYTRLIKEGEVPNFYTRDQENTTPTSIEEFTSVFKKIYDGQ